MFERIAYVSQAAPGVGPREVYEIIRSAHNRNAVAGLTGGLVFIDDHFVQVLEGEPFRLQPCFERIAADPRHRALSVRGRVRSEQRLFDGDWMALRLREQLPPGLLDRIAYAPGLPAPHFDGPAIEAFVHACCGAPALA